MSFHQKANAAGTAESNMKIEPVATDFNLGYSQSEYSLSTPSAQTMISAQSNTCRCRSADPDDECISEEELEKSFRMLSLDNLPRRNNNNNIQKSLSATQSMCSKGNPDKAMDSDVSSSNDTDNEANGFEADDSPNEYVSSTQTLVKYDATLNLLPSGSRQVKPRIQRNAQESSDDDDDEEEVLLEHSHVQLNENERIAYMLGRNSLPSVAKRVPCGQPDDPDVMYMGPTTSRASVCVDDRLPLFSTGAERRDAGRDIDALEEKLSAVVMEQKLSTVADGLGTLSGLPGLSTRTSVATPEVHYERMRQSNDMRNQQVRIQHMVFNCPLGDCRVAVNPSGLLRHILTDHINARIMPMHEVYEGEKISISFNPKALHLRRNYCLGVMLYKGTDANNTPLARGIMVENAKLPSDFLYLNSQLPLLVMICKTSWDMMVTGETRDGEREVTNLYIIWMFCPQALEPLHVSLMACDPQNIGTRCMIVESRNSIDAHDFSDVLRPDPNFMRLTHGDIKVLTRNFAETVQLELSIVAARTPATPAQ